MPLRAEVVVDPDQDFAPVDELAALLSASAEREPQMQPGDWTMTVRIVSDATISDFHSRYFADPTPTDVITFPAGDVDPSGDRYLGDVLLSGDTAAVQAEDAGHSREREVAFLALHGFLHLCGYDDATPEDRERMLQRQSELLAAFEAGRHPW